MALEELRDLLRGLRLTLDAQPERLGGLEGVESVLRAHDVAVHVLHVLDGLVQLLGRADDGAAHRDVVAVVELGGRLDDQVAPVLDRPLRKVGS